jgi:hypothetical protein
LLILVYQDIENQEKTAEKPKKTQTIMIRMRTMKRMIKIRKIL